MKRPRAAIAALALLAIGAYFLAPLPGPAVAAPSAGDCVTMRMWSNGYHSDIGVPAAALPEDHPLRALYPQAEMLLIGWGEKAFYYSDGTDLMLGLDAITPPSPSVMHVVDEAERGSRYLGPNADGSFAISHEGASRLSDFLADALVLDDSGKAIVVTPGKVRDHSVFLEARENFHLFNVCNHWMARALWAAGINVNTRSAWLAGPLLDQARRAAPAACPAALPDPISET
jgi:uncharacterized protein (TIGR02117 family)